MLDVSWPRSMAHIHVSKIDYYKTFSKRRFSKGGFLLLNALPSPSVSGEPGTSGASTTGSTPGTTRGSSRGLFPRTSGGTTPGRPSWGPSQGPPLGPSTTTRGVPVVSGTDSGSTVKTPTQSVKEEQQVKKLKNEYNLTKDMEIIMPLNGWMDGYVDRLMDEDECTSG